MIRDPEHETMPRRELEKLQLERLKAKVTEVYDKVPFYRRVFKKKESPLMISKPWLI